VPFLRGSARTHAAAVLSGLLFALAFPPRGWTVLLPLALVPWLVALWREPRRLAGLLSGALFGMAFWCVSIPWISFVVTHYGGQSSAMGVVCVALLALILAEWSAAVGWCVVACAPQKSWKRLAAFPLLWAASEHARSVVYGGFPWNLTAWGLARRPVWIQTASVWGVYGVGFVVVAVSALLAAAVVRRLPAFLLAAAAVVLLVGGIGLARLGGPDRDPVGSKIRVALVQPNLTEESRATPEGAAAGYAATLAQGFEAGAAGTDLLVFPESAFPLYWESSARLRGDLTRLASTCRCAVLFNDVIVEPGGKAFNVARIVDSGGLTEGIYRKVHLVPFGEYVPLPKIFFFARQISREIGEFSPAPSPTVLRSGPLAVGVGICYEILYPSLARRQSADGANLLATISNDSWYGKAGAQEQHFAGAVLRSVENGRFLVRAAITGISGVSNARGRIVAELPAGRAGTIFAVVSLATERTAWTRWGHVLPAAGDAAAGAVLVFGLARWRREREALRARPAALHGDNQ
jgi:apolipoprotein N-acyltransferase